MAKIEVWISISIFLAPKNVDHVQAEKVPRRRAVRHHSRQPSIQVTGVWWEWCPGRAMVKTAEADAPVPAATPSTPMPYVTDSRHPGAGDLRQTVCHYQYQRATAMHVSDRRMSVNMNSLYMAHWSTVDNLLAHVRWSVTASGRCGFNNSCAVYAPIQADSGYSAISVTATLTQREPSPTGSTCTAIGDYATGPWKRRRHIVTRTITR